MSEYFVNRLNANPLTAKVLKDSKLEQYVLAATFDENYLTSYLGVTNFIWLDGAFGGLLDITDMHIDGFVKFVNMYVV